MDLDNIKRGLRTEIKRRENEQYATFQCNVRQMCKDVLAKLEEQETEIAELKAQLESEKASRDADSVDAGMRERRLKRALWLARVMRAEAQWNRQLRDAGIAFAIGENKIWDFCNQRQKKWQGVERKCRAMAEKFGG